MSAHQNIMHLSALVLIVIIKLKSSVKLSLATQPCAPTDNKKNGHSAAKNSPLRTVQLPQTPSPNHTLKIT